MENLLFEEPTTSGPASASGQFSERDETTSSSSSEQLYPLLVRGRDLGKNKVTVSDVYDYKSRQEIRIENVVITGYKLSASLLDLMSVKTKPL